MIIYNSDRGINSVDKVCKLAAPTKKRVSRATHFRRNPSHSRKRLTSASAPKIKRLSRANKNFLESLGFTVISK